MENNVGKKVFIKFGTFHGMLGTIQAEVIINSHIRYLVKLQNGKVIPKKIKNVILLKADNK